MIEIIGFQINGTIYGGSGAFEALIKNNYQYEKYITKDLATLMGDLDLGHNWEQLSKCPVILTIRDDN